jgi:AAA ATPase domain
MVLLAINWQCSEPKVPLARQSQHAYRDTSMLVGRRFELEALAEVINLVRSEVSASLVIRGEPGVGKTVLLDELENLAYDFRVVVLKVSNQSYSWATPHCIASLSPSWIKSLDCRVRSGTASKRRSV